MSRATLFVSGKLFDFLGDLCLFGITTKRLMSAASFNKRPIVRLPPREARGGRVPNARRPARYYRSSHTREIISYRVKRNIPSALTSPDHFMTSARSPTLYQATSSAVTVSFPPTIDLLSSAAEDDPSITQPEYMEGVE